MGGILCCMSQPITEKTQPEKAITGRNQNINPRSSVPEKKQIRHINSSAQDKFRKVECMTLEDCFLASPNLNVHQRITGGEIQMFKHLPKRVYPSSSSPDTNQEFFTPRRSFSGADTLGRIDEDYEQDGDHDSLSISSISRSGSGKVKKKGLSFEVSQNDAEKGNKVFVDFMGQNSAKKNPADCPSFEAEVAAETYR